MDQQMMTGKPQIGDDGVPVRTRSGLPARILCTDRDDVFNIVALVGEYGGETVMTFTSAGKAYGDGAPEDGYDLVVDFERLEPSRRDEAVS